MIRFVWLACALGLAACNSISVTRTDFEPGKVLVLPPRDVVQHGQPHERGTGTGARLQQSVVARLRGTAFTPIETSSATFVHTAVAEKEAALAEARRLDATYCLQLVLGEFLDAAPMTFRSDYVTLEHGILWRSENGDVVWETTAPYQVAKGSNFGGIDGLIASIAEEVVGSIAP